MLIHVVICRGRDLAARWLELAEGRS